MKLVVKKKSVLDVLAKVQGLTGRKSSLAITENVLIRAEESGIALIATDLESGFEGFYPAAVESEGTIVLNAKKLFEIIRDFPTDDVLLNEVENHWIKIGNENVMYHIVGMNPEDFPEIPRIEDVPLYEIESDSLKRMIERTVMVSAAADDRRAHVNGIFLETIQKPDGKHLRMVSTDGSRLAMADHAIAEGQEIPFETRFLIPKKGLNEVAKFLSVQGSVQIGVKDNKFIVQKDHETIIIRLLEGEFPNYEGILVKDNHALKMNRQTFLMMLKRMSILSSETYKGVIFNYSENRLSVSTTNPDIGESKEDMEIEFSGETIEAAFNPRYFIEILNAIDEDSVIVYITDPKKPCLIEGENEKNFLSVIMPMRI